MGAGDDLRRLSPPLLRPGDSVAFVAPSKPVAPEDWEATYAWWNEQGFVPVPYFDPTSRCGMFSADDDVRFRFLQDALNSDAAAVVCMRGGYGLDRIIDRTDWTGFMRKPKWVCGFSDATPLINLAATKAGAAVHGPMFGAFAQNPDRSNHLALLEALTAFFPPGLRFDFPPHPYNRTGSAAGRLFGGNLSLICSNLATSAEIPSDGAVWFIEDVGEYLYRIDRMLTTLRRAGRLQRLAALVVGTFTELEDNDPPFGMQWQQIVRNAVEEYDFPVLFGIPAGHGPLNRPLYLGARVQIQVRNDGASWQYL
ncbi:MAG: LD-carboxypeptidase [Bacteroidia bacterium]|nr:LD-carboxypeptidase [Bacteroidia bacterium]